MARGIITRAVWAFILHRRGHLEPNDDLVLDYIHIVDGCLIAIMVVFILGTIGNVMSIVTLSTRGLRYQATTICLLALAVSDILVLATSVCRYRAYYVFLSEEQYLDSKFTVEVYLNVYVEPFYWMSLGMTSFIILLLTGQRFIAIRNPFWARKHFNPRRNITVLVIVILIPIVLTLPNFFYYKVEQEFLPFLNRTVHYEVVTDFGKNDQYRCVYLEFIIPILWYIIPWICLAVLNILLLRHVKRSARISHQVQMSQTLSSSSSSKHSRNLTILLIFLVLAYMVCNLPKCVLVFIRLVQSSSEDLCRPGSQGIQEFPRNVQEAADWVVSVFNIANSAVNFILYCVFGEKFRKAFRQMVCPCCKHLHAGISVKSVTYDTQSAL